MFIESLQQFCYKVFTSWRISLPFQLAKYIWIIFRTQLEGNLQKLDNVHADFRLWITAEPHPAFPIGLLQMGIKVTNEAPTGMKAGLRVSYQWITQVGLRHIFTHMWKKSVFERMPQQLNQWCFYCWCYGSWAFSLSSGKKVTQVMHVLLPRRKIYALWYP